MSLKYCALCKRNVEPKRVIGIGTLILTLCTFGFWLLTIPFYRKKCPLCKSTLLSNVSNNLIEENKNIEDDKTKNNNEADNIVKLDFEKKKRIVIIIGSIIAFFVITNFMVKSFNSETKNNNTNIKNTEEAQKIADEKTKQDKIKREQEAPANIKLLIDTAKNLDTKKTYNTVDQINADLYIINQFELTIKSYKNDFFNNDEIMSLLKQFENTLKTKQVALFPNLRKNYGDISRKLLWESDVDVKVFGTANNTIEFVGYVFATNKNISDSYSKIRDMIYKLRFDKVNFRWYEGGDGTQYTVESLKDNEFELLLN